MKTNNLGKVGISSSKRPRARFNLSHDVNTTCGFGETQPLFCRHMQPNSKMVVDPKQLVRLAPMVAPTFGRMHYRSFATFIPFSDLSENFAALMAQTTISRGGKTFVPKRIPTMELRNLSALCLVGAQITMYAKYSDDAGYSNAYVSLGDSCHWDTPASELAFPTFGYASTLLGHFAPKDSINHSSTIFPDVFGFTSGTASQSGWLDLSWLLDGPSAYRGKDGYSGYAKFNRMFIPVANPTAASFFSYVPRTETEKLDVVDYYPYSPVLPDSADFLIGHEVNVLQTDKTTTQPNRVYFAIKLSSFGKRIRKILLGLGYQINFGSAEQVSLYPLFAYYKAYFDSFGLTLFQNWESTNAAKMLSWFDYENKFADVVTNTSRSDWSDNYLDAAFWRSSKTVDNGSEPMTDDTITRNLWSFFVDLGNTFATDSQDYVSAHIATTAVSPKLGLSSEFIDVDSVGAGITEINSSENSPTEPVNSHAYVNKVIHGNLDSEYLKKLYKWTNYNTIAGRRIAELLRAQGLGAYVDECKSNFIGSYDLQINIDDVVSSADTKVGASDEGALLGQYGGKGLSFGKGRKWSWETSEDGYFIVMAAMIPQSGYCQAVDGDLLCVEKLDFYNPEFDGLGMEATRKLQVLGTANVFRTASDGGNSSSYGVFDKWNKNFGFIPRYSSLKIANNKMNGDFNLRSTRTKFLPYTMDKLIDVDDKQIVAVDGQRGYEVYKFADGLALDSVPTANPIWRFVARYPWLENYNRIFANTGSDVLQYLVNVVGTSSWFDLESQQEDNFLVHNVFNVQYYAAMLPIEESFETKNNGNEGASNTGMSKA